MAIFLICLAAYFWVMSLWAFLAFVRDKEHAQSGGWRVPETTLLTLALLGGWPGAKLAQRRFRHKTRKEPFRSLLNACAIGPLLIAAVAVTAWVRPEFEDRRPSAPELWAYMMFSRVFGAEGEPPPGDAPRTVTINRGGVRETVTFGD